MNRGAQRGFSLWMILGCMVLLLVGSWQFSRHKEAKRADKASADAVAQKEANEERLTAERKAVEGRQVDAKKRQDALQVSLRAVDDLLARWGDAMQIASSTSRVALATPVGVLQSIKREAEQLTVPPCLDSGKAELVKSMEASVEGYLVFMRNEAQLGNELAKVYFDQAGASMDTFKNARLACPVPDSSGVVR